MTFPLTITLRSATDQPIAGATCLLSPETVNPTSAGTVLTTTSATTDANGVTVLQVLPSAKNSYYILRITDSNNVDVINPFRFQMPGQATTLTSLLQGALVRNEPVPLGIRINVPNGQDFHDTFENDIDLIVDAAADTFGEWVELWRVTHNDTNTALYNVVGELTFDPAWAYDNGDRGEVDVQVCHRLPNGDIKRILVHHDYLYIRNRGLHDDKGSSLPDGWAKLIQGEYIDIRARASRQLTTADGNRKIVLLAAESGVHYVKFVAGTTTSLRVFVDTNTMTGTGEQNDPIKPLIPFTQTEKDKLANIPANAQPNRSISEIVTGIEGQATEGKLDATTGLKNLQQAIGSRGATTLNELTDVNFTDLTVNDLMQYDGNNFVNRQLQLSSAQVLGLLANHPLPRTSLSGNTTVEGGATLPSADDVANFTLRVKQDTTADNPGLYLSSATYDTPVRDRNRVILNVNDSSLFSLNPQRGSADDNYNQFVGTYSARARAGTGNITIALYNDPPPPTTIYIRGIASNDSVIALTRSGPGFINGRTYSVYSANVAASRVANTANTKQTLTFYTNSGGSVAYNFKPTTEHHSRAWHLLSPVNPDYNITDPRSPAFIKNKPTPTSLGRLIASTANLPTTSTAFSTSATIARYTPQLTIGDAEVTTNYTVSNNSILSTPPYPVTQIGWWVRAMVLGGEKCRLFVPLSPTVQYVDTTSILAETRLCAHAHMGADNALNFYLAYQAQAGNQAAPRGAGTTANNIEVFVAINTSVGSIAFSSHTTIEVREAIIGN